eukprot:6192218-Pleurochrysis_carterae.AAC.5
MHRHLFELCRRCPPRTRRGQTSACYLPFTLLTDADPSRAGAQFVDVWVMFNLTKTRPFSRAELGIYEQVRSRGASCRIIDEG